MKKDEPYHGRVKIGYCSRKHDEIICYKNTRLYWSTCSDKDKKFYYFHGSSRINSEMRTCFMEHQYYMEQIFSWLLCLPPFYTLLYPLKSLLCLFSYCSIYHPLLQSQCLLWFNFDIILLLLTVSMHVMTALSDI